MTGSSSWLAMGAGGHQASLVDVLLGRGDRVVARCPSPVETMASDVDDEGRRGFDDDDEALSWAAGEGVLVAIAIGDPAARERVLARADSWGASTPVVTARSATVSAAARIGPASIVCEHAHVGPGAVLGAGVIVNTAAVVEHHASVGDFTHCAPRAVLLGAAVVGSRVLIGSGATVLPGVRVGDGSTVGAGAVVHRTVAEGETVVGVPARRTVPDRGAVLT